MDRGTKKNRNSFVNELKSFIPKLLLLGFINGIFVQFGTILINSDVISFGDSFVIALYFVAIFSIVSFFGGVILFSLLYFIFSFLRPSIIARGFLERYFFIIVFAIGVFYPLFNRLSMNYSYYSLFPFADTYYKMAILLWSVLALLILVSVLLSFAITLIYQLSYNIMTGLFGRWQITAGMIVLFICSSIFPVLYNRSVQIEFSQMEGEVQQQAYGKDNNVFLIGIDGADWRIIDPLLKESKLPNFQKLIDDGVRARMKTSVPTYSPILWTSIATGQKPEKHGIKSFIMMYFFGAKTPLQDILERGFFSKLDYLKFTGLVNVFPSNTYLRKTPAIWNILSRVGRKSVVVNWFPSWPAEHIKGYMISDRFIRSVITEKELHHDPCGKYNHLVYPDSICREIADDTESYLSEDLKNREFVTSFQKFSYQSENIYFNLSLDMLSRNNGTDFFTVYLRGTDDFEHKYWKYRKSDAKKFPYVTDEEREKFGSVIDDYYIQVDAYIGEVLKRINDNTSIIVISDHGHEPFFTGLNSKQNGAHGLGPDAIFIASGKNISKEFKGGKPSIYDITPTILYLLGLPTAEDMDGRVLENVIDTKLLEENPPKTIPTYYIKKDKKTKEEGEKNKKSMGDEKLMNKLKALGYIN